MKKEYEIRLLRHLHGFYESRLDLININVSNTYTNFECISNINSMKSLSKSISFSIRGRNNSTSTIVSINYLSCDCILSVQVERAMPKNLTCIKSSKEIHFQWLKVTESAIIILLQVCLFTF